MRCHTGKDALDLLSEAVRRACNVSSIKKDCVLGNTTGCIAICSKCDM